jgi:hypothetical protein
MPRAAAAPSEQLSPPEGGPQTVAQAIGSEGGSRLLAPVAGAVLRHGAYRNPTFDPGFKPVTMVLACTVNGRAIHVIARDVDATSEQARASSFSAGRP